MFLKALGEHIFFLRLEERKLPDFRQIAVETLLPAQRRNGCHRTIAVGHKT